MRHLIILILAVSTLILARPPEETVYSVFDDYYGEVLLPRDDIRSIGNKIRYPGFIRDTMPSVGVGYLPQNSEVASSFSEITQKSVALRSTQIGPDDFYCWAEKYTRFGSIGVRLGNMSFGEHAENQVYSRFERQRSGQGTIWFSPGQQTLLDGISAEVGFRHSVDSVFDKRPFYAEVEKQNNDFNFLHFRTTLKMEHGKHLFLGYEWIDSTVGTINDYRDYDSTGRINHFNSNQQKSDCRSNLITAGVMSAGGKRLNAVLSYASSDFNSQYFSDYATFSGVCGAYVEGVMSKKVDCLKHSLRLGLYGLAGSNAKVTDAEHIDFNAARYKLSRDNIEMLGIARIPCIIDINLFGSAIYGIINVTPEIYGRYYRRTADEGIATGHSLQLTVRQLSIGLRGRIGEKLEFLLVPSLQSNIFVSGLEIRYLL